MNKDIIEEQEQNKGDIEKLVEEGGVDLTLPPIKEIKLNRTQRRKYQREQRLIDNVMIKGGKPSRLARLRRQYKEKQEIEAKRYRHREKKRGIIDIEERLVITKE